MMSFRRFLLLLFLILLTLLFLAVPGVSWADTLEDAARTMAHRISGAVSPKQPVRLVYENRSSLVPAQIAQLRKMLEGELARLGNSGALEATNGSQARIGISENLESFLLIAEVSTDRAIAVIIVPLPKSAIAPSTNSPSQFRIEQELVFEQQDPILDFALIPRPSNRLVLAVLDPEALTFHEWDGGGWGAASSVPLPPHKPWPRDLRGWLRAERDHTEFVFPGFCGNGGLGADSLWIRNVGAWCSRITARSAGENWTDLGSLVEGRNYFDKRHDGVLLGGESPTFFSVAILSEYGQGSYAGSVLARVDGKAALTGSRGELLATFSEWGSELAGVSSKCGSRRQILTTRPGDWTVADLVQAYEIVGTQATSVGAPVQFPGPVMALWTSDEEDSAHAVVRNLKTGRYEAYKLTIACGQ